MIKKDIQIEIAKFLIKHEKQLKKNSFDNELINSAYNIYINNSQFNDFYKNILLNIESNQNIKNFLEDFFDISDTSARVEKYIMKEIQREVSEIQHKLANWDDKMDISSTKVEYCAKVYKKYANVNNDLILFLDGRTKAIYNFDKITNGYSKMFLIYRKDSSKPNGAEYAKRSVIVGEYLNLIRQRDEFREMMNRKVIKEFISRRKNLANELIKEIPENLKPIKIDSKQTDIQKDMLSIIESMIDGDNLDEVVDILNSV